MREVTLAHFILQLFQSKPCSALVNRGSEVVPKYLNFLYKHCYRFETPQSQFLKINTKLGKSLTL